jgi:quinol monooxygenase YgiN
MISINLDFKTKSGKNLEFMQTIGSIIVDLRRVKGCIGVDLQQDNQYKDQFNLGIDLQNGENIQSLLGSNEFDFFQGAVKVLCTPPLVEIKDGSKKIKIDTHQNPKDSLSKQINSKTKV